MNNADFSRNHPFSPRLWGAAARFALGAAVGALACAAPAHAIDGFGQAEWAQHYDADASVSVERSTTPLLSPRTLAATEAAIQKYQAIVANGGWNKVPAGATLKLGSSGPAVLALRKRLAITGDLDPAASESGIYDSYVEAGVKRFQARHGLIPTGVATRETLAVMNVPADYRLHQLEVNLVRLRSFAANLGDRFVEANIPAAMVDTVENDTIATRHRAGVGSIDRQSPVMQTRALDVDFNPYWTVPASIIRKDLIPRMQANPNYLTENHIRIYDKRQQRGAAQPDQLAFDGGDQLPFPRGSEHRQFARRGARQHQQSLRRLYARHAGEGRVRRRFPLRLLGLHAPPERARLCRLAAQEPAGLGPRPYRSGHRLRRAA